MRAACTAEGAKKNSPTLKSSDTILFSRSHLLGHTALACSVQQTLYSDSLSREGPRWGCGASKANVINGGTTTFAVLLARCTSLLSRQPVRYATHVKKHPLFPHTLRPAPSNHCKHYNSTPCVWNTLQHDAPCQRSIHSAHEPLFIHHENRTQRAALVHTPPPLSLATK